MFFPEFKWDDFIRENQVLGKQPGDISECGLNARDNNLWCNGGDGDACARQADLQVDGLKKAFDLITSSGAGPAMVPQCMNSLEGVNELCGCNPNAAHPFPAGAGITKKCNIKDAD